MTSTDTINRADWIETHDGRTGKVAAVGITSVIASMDDTGEPERVALSAIARVIPAR